MSQNNASRFLFVKNIAHKTKGDEMWDLFGKYGPIRQIRLGNSPKTRGTAFVVYEDLADSKQAFEHLNGFHLGERYLVVLYHQPAKQTAKDLARREAELAETKRKHNID